MFIINLTYEKPISEVEKFLKEHIDFLDKNYKAKKFVCSGRKNPRTGGIIICNCVDKATVEQLIQSDPFHREKIAHYEFIEFIPSKFSDSFKTVIDEIENAQDNGEI